MTHFPSHIATFLALTLSACGSTQQPVPSAAGNDAQGSVTGATDASASASSAASGSTTISQQFKTLDDYLAHLELTQKPVDGPWYREVQPGVYELQTGNLRILGDAEKPKTIFTRDELERQFGFKR